MKICLLTISVSDRYEEFAKKLISSVQKNFLTNSELSIFLIGDKNLINNDLFYKINHIPSPLTTLLRYHYIYQIKNLLDNFDLIYYIDADMEVVNKVSIEEIIPENIHQYVVVKHFYEDYCKISSTEENENSMAYVKNLDAYYQACFYGAYKNAFFDLVGYGNKMVNIDLKNHIIAKWFDESYFNKYMMSKNLKVLPSSYAHPFKEKSCDSTKIIHYNSYST